MRLRRARNLYAPGDEVWVYDYRWYRGEVVDVFDDGAVMVIDSTGDRHLISPRAQRRRLRPRNAWDAVTVG